MAKTVGLDRLMTMLADRITDGVRESLREILDGEFRRMERRIGVLRGPGRPRGGKRGRPAGRGGRSARPAASPKEIERRRGRILEIVKANPGGVSSVAVARRMRIDPRSAGKLLAGLAAKKAVKKDGDLYRLA